MRRCKGVNYSRMRRHHTRLDYVRACRVFLSFPGPPRLDPSFSVLCSTLSAILFNRLEIDLADVIAVREECVNPLVNCRKPGCFRHCLLQPVQPVQPVLIANHHPEDTGEPVNILFVGDVDVWQKVPPLWGETRYLHPEMHCIR